MTDSSVTLHEVMEWAWGQNKYLTPTQHHVLLYLTFNAFRHAENPEGAYIGQVLSGRTSEAKIRMGTGYSERTVRDALHALQDQCYIIADMKGGKANSTIMVFWLDHADGVREEIRAGIRKAPKEFQRAPKKTTKKTPKRHLTVVEYN